MFSSFQDNGKDDDEDWGEDVSDEAVAKRMLELTDAAKSMAMSDDLEKTANERMDLFYTFVKVCVIYQLFVFSQDRERLYQYKCY